MIGAFVILAFTVAVGLLLWIWEKFRIKRHGSSLHHHSSIDAGNAKTDKQSVCCGLHAICEKTGKINQPPIYYDDEELDRFATRNPDDYSDEEIEEFRDVLITLLPSDASGWTASLHKRNIHLPSCLLPELELLLSEA